MNKKYWLRGGIVSVAINIVFTIVLTWVYQYENSIAVDNSDMVWGILQLGSLFFIPVSFLFGSFIGWLYGKTKN